MRNPFRNLPTIDFWSQTIVPLSAVNKSPGQHLGTYCYFLLHLYNKYWTPGSDYAELKPPVLWQHYSLTGAKCDTEADKEEKLTVLTPAFTLDCFLKQIIGNASPQRRLIKWKMCLQCSISFHFSALVMNGAKYKNWFCLQENPNSCLHITLTWYILHPISC